MLNNMKENIKNASTLEALKSIVERANERSSGTSIQYSYNVKEYGFFDPLLKKRKITALVKKRCLASFRCEILIVDFDQYIDGINVLSIKELDFN